MPGFEQMMNSLSFDQRARKNGAKEWRTRPWCEALDIDPAREIEKLFLGDAARAKSVGSFFRKHEQESGEIILFQRTFGAQHEIILPAADGSSLPGASRLGPRSDTLGKITVPGRNFYDR